MKDWPGGTPSRQQRIFSATSFGEPTTASRFQEPFRGRTNSAPQSRAHKEPSLLNSSANITVPKIVTRSQSHSETFV